MSIRKGTNIIAGRSPYQPALFDFKWADHILNDLSWIRSDTFIWYSKIKYDAAYNHLVADITGKEVQSETVDGIIITYYLANDGHKICMSDQEEYLIALFNKTGIAWYYILDTENQRFKLPRTELGFTGLRSEVGKYVAPGLPNITGTFSVVGSDSNTGWVSNVSSMTGAFYGISVKSGYQAYASSTNNTNSDTHRAGFDASCSNPIYGASTTVQPPVTEMYLYFYVGEFTQDALENAAALNLDTVEEMVDTKLIDKQDVSTAVNYNNVSNCITEIPQNIKLELNNGGLILKAGSKVYVPNGFESDGTTPKFDEIIIESDVSSPTTSLNGQNIYIYTADFERPIGRTNNNTSGPTAPTSPSNMDTWYDTTNNLVKRYSGEAWETYKWSLPFMLATGNGSVLTSIDQVFNGFGYIGSTVFALPGVTQLIPNGFNADGTLNNIKIIANTVQTRTLTATVSNATLAARFNIATPFGIGTNAEYDESRNINTSSGSDWNYGFIGTISLSSGVVTSLTTKTSFHAVDYSEADFVVSFQKPTSENNYTWYRKYKSGWVEQGGEFTLTISAGNGNININLPVLMANGRYTALVNGGFISNVAFLKWNITSRNTSYFNVVGDTGNSTSSGTTNTCCWQVSGMAAS